MSTSSKNPASEIGPYMIVMSLMFFWNMTRNINDILIPHLKRGCQLSDFESSLIQSAFFGAYFLMALPAGLYIQKKGYKSGMFVGLVMASIGAAMFYPAAQILYYPLFLCALFVMAAGFTFLEVAATPYISKLGNPETASSRLSLAAAIGSVGAALAPYIGSLLLLHEKDITDNQMNVMSSVELKHFLISEANLVKMPYIILALTFLLAALLVYVIKLPTIQEDKTNYYSFKNIFTFSHTVYGIFAVFAYVGAEVGIVSFMIRYSKSLSVSELTEQKAALYITFFMSFVLLGRLLGSLVLKKFAPHKILLFSAIGSILCVSFAILEHSSISLWLLSLVGLFTSVVYPILFTLSIKNLGVYTKTASSLLIMGIVGGAIVPPLMGKVSDMYNIRLAYVLPIVCYGYILFFSVKGYVVRIKKDNS